MLIFDHDTHANAHDRITFSNVYGVTTSGNFTLTVTSSSSKSRKVTLRSGNSTVAQTVSSSTYRISGVALEVGQNEITLEDPASSTASAKLSYDVKPLYYP